MPHGHTIPCLSGGDRAQTIQEGVSFRFESLKDFLFDLQRPAPGSANVKPRVPKLMTLTENKRTHQQVLDVANQVLRALRWLFPGDLDSIMVRIEVLGSAYSHACLPWSDCLVLHGFVVY